MARTPKKKEPAYEDLPVLTERPEADADIPVLTETLAIEAPKPAPKKTTLTEEQYQELVGQLTHQIEATLSKKFATRLEALWQETWQELEKDLPELIRTQLAGQKRRSSK